MNGRLFRSCCSIGFVLPLIVVGFSSSVRSMGDVPSALELSSERTRNVQESEDGTQSLPTAPRDKTADEALLASYQRRADVKQSEYARIRKLAMSGSVSQYRLRRAKLESERAQLELFSIRHPDRQDQTELALTELQYRYAETELAVVEKLFERGSVSRLEFERTQSAFDIAKLNLEVARNSGSRNLLDVRIAERKLELVEQEFDMVTELLKSKSVSQSTFDRVKQRLQWARSEVDLAKQSLGVIVKQIKPQQPDRK